MAYGTGGDGVDIGVPDAPDVRENGASVAPTAPEPRRVLALSAQPAPHADPVVSADALAGELRAGRPPRSARTALRARAPRLRGLVAAALGACPQPRTVPGRAPGLRPAPRLHRLRHATLTAPPLPGPHPHPHSHPQPGLHPHTHPHPLPGPHQAGTRAGPRASRTPDSWHRPTDPPTC
ncbi:hypothetical protein ACWGKW_43105 [Streptomyces sp. NPDC054766]